jgi:hypothetical protein
MQINDSGYYLLMAKLDVQFSSLGEVTCQLSSPTGDSDYGEFANFPATADSVDSAGTISLMVIPNSQLTAGQKVMVSCENTAVSSTAAVSDVTIAALQVGSVSNALLSA